MPRYSKIPAILRTATHAKPKLVTRKNTPRLWNAKRRIKDKLPLTPSQLAVLRTDPDSTAWREQTSPDVVEFIDQNTYNAENTNTVSPDESLLKEEKAYLLRSPSKYFSRPHRVPLRSRKQVCFPTFVVSMIRKPNDSPYYASFRVPLWFNKLDTKDYLKSVYNVDVVHVRSYTVENTLRRAKHPNARKEGAYYRPKAEKRMKVQLVEPFQWPAEIKDFSDFNKDEFWQGAKASMDEQSLTVGPMAKLKPNNFHRRTIAEQARSLLAGRDKWSPSWKQIPDDLRVLDGLADPPKTKESKPQRLQILPPRSALGRPLRAESHV